MTPITKHWLAHIALTALCITLFAIILQPTPKPTMPDTSLIEAQNFKLGLRVDSLSSVAAKYQAKADSLLEVKKRIEVRYINRNTVINEIADTNLLDSFNAVYSRFQPAD